MSSDTTPRDATDGATHQAGAFDIRNFIAALIGAYGLIVVEPQRIDVGGPDFLAGPTAAVVRGLVTIRQPVEGVPEGLVLQQVTVQGDGFRALLSGEDVRLDG